MVEIKRHAGVYVAPLTPMNSDLSVDIPRYLQHCHRLLDAGCHGLMPLGSTGEGHSLTVRERLGLMDALANSGLPVDRMLVGTSGLAYPDTIELARHAVGIGVGGICVQPPFYYKPVDDDGLLQFYSKVIESVGENALRMYVYDYEGFLHIHHSLDLFRRLFERFPENAVGIKDSTGNAELLEQRCKAFPDREIFVGVDQLSLTGLRAGAVGTMSSTSNIIPDTTTALYENWQNASGEELHQRIKEVQSELSRFSRIPALKAIVGWQTGELEWGYTRLPLRRLNAKEERKLHNRVSGLGCDRSPARSWRMNDPLSIAGHERTQGWKIWLPGVKVGFQP